MHHNPQIDSLYKKGHNGAAVVLLHGFTGTPDSMRPLANKLHEEGFTVIAPLLAGHGTTPEKCAQTKWPDWIHTAEQAVESAKSQCEKVFVAGLSLGSLLTLKLAIDSPEKISGIACLATPLFLHAWPAALLPLVNSTPLKFFWKYQKKFGVDMKDESAKENFWNYDSMPLACISSLIDLQHIVRKMLNKVTAPILLMHSRHDSTAPYASMNQVAQAVASNITETVTLENSYHIITLDFEKELVATKVTDFFKRFL